MLSQNLKTFPLSMRRPKKPVSLQKASNTYMDSTCRLRFPFRFIIIPLLLFEPLIMTNIRFCLADENLNVIRCIAPEREALVAFKKGLTDPSGRLSSWQGEDCCKWSGITCNNRTGHVTELNLRNPYQLIINGGGGDPTTYKTSCLGGKIAPDLLAIPYLTYLDLSFNDFEGAQIPHFFGGFKNLRYLNLSYSNFGGNIPLQLGNLSTLHYLDLYADSSPYAQTYQLQVDNLHWLSGLSSLKHLNLGFVKINTSSGADWLQAVNMLPSLEVLNLHYCQLQVLRQSLAFVNFTSLSVLDLSENSFNSPIPPWLFNLTSLRELYLIWNFFTGPIPDEFARLKLLRVLDLSNNLNLDGQIPGVFGILSKLQILDLSANNLSGEIQEFLDSFSVAPKNTLTSLRLSSNSLEGELPSSLGVLQNLEHLDLSGNSFWGCVPPSIGKLSLLVTLDLSYNKMNGTIPEGFGQLSGLVDVNLMANSWKGILKESHFMNLRSLVSIRLTTDPTRSLILNVSSKWVPPFRLKNIQLENCQVGPSFPLWLCVQSELTSVVLKNVGISDTIPGEWFLKLSQQITYLVLSNNQIMGKLPNQLESPHLSIIDLSTNHFEGPLPLWSTNATEFYLQDNLFSGSIPENIDVLMPKLQKVYLSRNHLSGTIPSSICNIEALQIISLRSNRFSGELPNCWYHSLMLWAIDVSSNELTGNIPSSFGFLPSLSVLLLSDNHFAGVIPSSLQNCSGITSIDLTGNKISGSLPSWIGEKYSSLFMLRLGSNFFSGPIPQEICHSSNLHILDFSGNKFSGVIPNCFGNLSALVHGNNSEVFEQLLYMATRGRNPEYSTIVANVNSIDLSGNNLIGKIQYALTNLSALRILNLSRNEFDGKITEKIGDLKHLENLDLSHNHLVGMIPQSLASVTSLLHLNLSYNILEGRIPTALQRFNDPSVFNGNPLLCGAPLPSKCQGDHRIL